MVYIAAASNCEAMAITVASAPVGEKRGLGVATAQYDACTAYSDAKDMVI